MAFNPFEAVVQAASLAWKSAKLKETEQFRAFNLRPQREQQDPQLEEPALTGFQRFEAERKQIGFDLASPDYDNWALTLTPDPADPSYNNVLFDVQRKAQQRIRQREEAQRRAEQRRFAVRSEATGTVDRARQLLWPHLRPQEEKKKKLKPEGLEFPDTGAKPAAEGEPAAEPGMDQPPSPTMPTQPAPEGPTVTILGPDGNPLPNQYVARPDGSLVDVSSQLEFQIPNIPESIYEGLDQESAGILQGLEGEMQAGLANSGLPMEGTLLAGEYVWMGGTPEQPQFMSSEHAITLPYQWSVDQVLYAQEALGLEPTGFADPGLINEWAKVVATAAGYTAAGRNVDPNTVLDWVHDAVMAQGDGSGGGGGGGAGGRSLTRSESSAVLRQVMMDELGREPTPEEANAFHAAMGGIGLEADFFQLATEWVRNQSGGEAATFQVATDFYQAMLEVLGTGDQAAEPTGVAA